jgi:hypothetical protein
MVGKYLLIQRGMGVAVIRIGAHCEPYAMAVFKKI